MHLLQNVVLAEWGPLLIVLGLTPAMARELERIPGARRSPTRSSRCRSGSATYYAWHVAVGLRRRAPPPVDDPPRSSTRLYFFAGCLLWWPVVHGSCSSGDEGAVPLRARSCSAARSACCSRCSPSAVYDFYEHVPRLWGLSPLSDQQLAGMTMASEQAIVLFAAFAFYLRRFLHEEASADTFRAPTVRKT